MVQIASDQGISRNSLQNWVNQFAAGVRVRRGKEVDAAQYFAKEMGL